MGIFDSVGNAAQRAKINGEIVLLDRQAATRKREFGIALFDLVMEQETKSKAAIITTPALFKAVEAQIKEPLEATVKLVKTLEGEKYEKEQQSLVLEAKREKSKGGFGSWMSDSGTDAKLTVQITLLEREIKQAKEKFGLDIWDTISEDNSVMEGTKKGGIKAVTGAIGGLSKGVKSTVANTLGKASGDERAIQACVEKAKEDVKFIEDSKKRKLSIIDSLSK